MYLEMIKILNVVFNNIIKEKKIQYIKKRARKPANFENTFLVNKHTNIIRK